MTKLLIAMMTKLLIAILTVILSCPAALLADWPKRQNDRAGPAWHLAEIERALECLLLAQSGHGDRAGECPLSRVKRTLIERAPMSANDPKRTLPSLT
jgi:hypothetical protein